MQKRCSFSRWALICLTLVGLPACQWQPAADTYGLELAISMRVSPEDLSVMRTGAYTKSDVGASIGINGQDFRARVKFAGASTIDDLKRSYDVELASPYRGRTAYRLNATIRDPSALRTLLTYQAFSLIGYAMPEVQPVAVWLNGDYAGLYLLQERYDADYFASRALQPLQLYQAEFGNATLAQGSNLESGFSVKIGSEERFDLKALVGLVVEAPAESLRQHVDVDDVARYMAISALVDNSDGIDNNYYLVRTQQEPRFRVLPWDFDLTFGELHGVNDASFFNRNALFTRLASATEPYRSSYVTAFRLAKDRASAAILSDYAEVLAAQIEDAYAHDWFLSTGDLSLQEHVRQLKQHLAEQEARMVDIDRM